MKQISLAIAIFFLVLTSGVNAQTSARDFKINTVDDKSSSVTVESKAYKNFRRLYPSIENEKWLSEKNYSFATFEEKGVLNKVVFTPNGKIDYTLKSYGEKNLPSTVRSAVKSVYYDYEITNAQELKVKNKIIYLVKITDRNSWKTIRVHDGNLEEIEYYVNVISPCR